MEGEFAVIKKTDKALHLKRIKDGFYSQYTGRDVVIPIGKGKRTKFCPAVGEYSDGEIIVYHQARGIPFSYIPIK